MKTIEVSQLAELVLKAYIHFGVADSRINRRWLVEQDLYAAEKAVARCFNALNGKSVVTMEQICQHGREIACEGQGTPLYKAWCGIKEVIENDWLYAEQPFQPAESIARTVLFEEYLLLSERVRNVHRQQSSREFKDMTNSADPDREQFERIDIAFMMDEAKTLYPHNADVLKVLNIIDYLHFAPSTCNAVTIESIPVLDTLCEETKELETMPNDNIVEGIEETEYEEQSLFESKKAQSNLQKFKEKLQKVYGDDVELVSEYHGMKSQITLRCKHCGKEWTRRGDNIVGKPYGCPRCAARKAVTENEELAGCHSFDFRAEYVIASIDKCFKGEYEVVEMNAKDNSIKLRHKCGTTFVVRNGGFNNMLLNSGGIPCPNCRMDVVEDKFKYTKEETLMSSEHENTKTIGLFELQKLYYKAYMKHVGGKMETGWKSMTNSMRAVMPNQYAYEKITNKGRHVNLPVPIEDIEWITYYYADMAKTPTTDSVSLNRAIRNSKVWGEILSILKPQEEEKAEVKQESVEQATQSNHIVTIEEQEEAKRIQKLQELQEKNSRKALERALAEANNTHFANTIDAIIKMIGVAKSMHTLQDEVVAYIAKSIGVKIGEVSSDELKQLKEELEQLKITNADLHNTIDELQQKLKEANEWKENVKGLLASA